MLQHGNGTGFFPRNNLISTIHETWHNQSCYQWEQRYWITTNPHPHAPIICSKFTLHCWFNIFQKHSTYYFVSKGYFCPGQNFCNLNPKSRFPDTKNHFKCLDSIKIGPNLTKLAKRLYLSKLFGMLIQVLLTPNYNFNFCENF